MKRAIYPLYAAADESRVSPLLDGLRSQGVSVRTGADSPRRQDALLLFLSKNVTADSPVTDTFFRLNGGRELVIPVDLDGSTPPEELQNVLMARHTLDGTKYDPEELASRIVLSVRPQRQPSKLLPLAAAVLLLVVGGVILWKQLPRPESAAPVIEATPTAAPTEDPPVPGIEVDLDSIAELTIVGDRMVCYTWDQGYNQYKDSDCRNTDGFAYDVWQEDGAHFYSTEDGSEFSRAAWDLTFLTRLVNLKYLTLCIADVTLPDLSGLEKLMGITLQYCDVPDLEGLRGSPIHWIEYHGGSVTDFSPLSDCLALKSVDLDLVYSRAADFSGFCPKKLSSLRIVNGYDLSSVDLTGLLNCSTLLDLKLENLPIDSLAFLSNAHRLTDLRLNQLDGLKDLSGLENANLNLLELYDCPDLTDISALSACRRISYISLSGVGRLRDVSVLGSLSSLNVINIWGAQLSNLDFLRELSNKNNLSLGLGNIPADCGGLESIGSFENLEIGDNYAAAAPYLENKPVRNLTVYNENGLDLSTLPQINGELFLCRCDVRDLNGLGARRIRKLGLVDCQYLRSLAGTEGLEQMNQLEVRGCPRLTDWSPLDGRTFTELILRGTYSLPDFGKLSFLSLTLENTVDLTDLSCLDEVSDENSYTFSFPGLDQVASLQPLFRLRGDALEVPPQLQEQAAELVESGRFRSWSVAYPDGSWEPDTVDVTLLSWEELDDLPRSVLRRVRTLTVVGDVLVNEDAAEVWEDTRDGRPAAVLRDKATGEETAVTEAGTTLTDLSRLTSLTGLENLALWYQPLTDLEGIQALEDLVDLEVKYSPDFADASAAFTVQTLERVCFSHTGLAAIQGIQNLVALRELYIGDTKVTDMSPLEKVDYTFCMQEENGGGFSLEVMKPREDPVLTADDFAPLSAIPAFCQLDVSWVPSELWQEAVQNAAIRRLNAQCGAFTSNEALAAFAAAHPELEEIQITFNDLTDISCLQGLQHLRYVEVSDNMPEAIASLGDGYGFELNVRPW